MKIKISAETKQKLSWIGTRLAIGLVIAFLGSIVLEGFIYGLGHKYTIIPTSEYNQALGLK